MKKTLKSWRSKLRRVEVSKRRSAEELKSRRVKVAKSRIAKYPKKTLVVGHQEAYASKYYAFRVKVLWEEWIETPEAQSAKVTYDHWTCRMVHVNRFLNLSENVRRKAKQGGIEIWDLRSLETRRRSRPLIREGHAPVDFQLQKIDIQRKEGFEIWNSRSLDHEVNHIYWFRKIRYEPSAQEHHEYHKIDDPITLRWLKVHEC